MIKAILNWLARLLMAWSYGIPYELQLSFDFPNDMCRFSVLFYNGQAFAGLLTNVREETLIRWLKEEKFYNAGDKQQTSKTRTVILKRGIKRFTLKDFYYYRKFLRSSNKEIPSTFVSSFYNFIQFYII